MIRRIKLIPPLIFLLVVLFGQSPVASAQTGTVKGEVRLVPVGQREGEPRMGVSVCAVYEGVYEPGFDCGRCKENNYGNNCRVYRTDSHGQFSTQPLAATQIWYFIPYKKGYTLKTPPGICVIEADRTKTTVPAPLLLDQVAGQGRIDRTDRDALANSSAPSGPERKGTELSLTLILYEGSGPQDFSGGTGEPTIILVGTVVDKQGRQLKDADVFVSDFSEFRDATKSPIVSQTTTDANGRFRLELPSHLEAGTYLFSVTLEGFRPYIRSLNQVVAQFKYDEHAAATTSKQRNDTIILTRSEELREKSDPLVETIEATRRHVFTPEIMQTLPVPGTRSFDQFALLAPGVLPPPETFSGAGPGVSAGVGTAGQFSINGLRSRENNFTIEGSDNNDEDTGTRRQGFIMTVPQPIESVQELQIITALPDAQFGRNIGGQINALTKSGGAGRFHGSLYGYIADNHLSAPEPFDQTGAQPGFTPRRSLDGAPVLLDGTPLVRRSQTGGEDQFTRVQLGFAVGGQLTRDNDTSYFVSGERQDVRADKEAHFAMPTVRQRGAFASGDTGLLLTDGPNARTPLYPASVPGNAIFSLFPFPNNPLGPYGENTYSTVLPADGHGWRFSGKLGREFKGDPPGGKWWKAIFTTKAHVDQFTVRYNFTDELSTLPVTGGAIFSSLRPRVQTQNLAGFINRTLSATTTDTIRLSAAGTRFSFGERRDASLLDSSALPDTSFLLNAPLLLNVTKPNSDGTLNAPSFISAAGTSGSALLNTLGYQGVTQTEQITGPLGQVFIAGFSPLGVDVENFPQTRLNRTFQFADTVTAIRSPNVFTFGVDVRRTRIDSRLERNFRPRAVFNGLPGAPLANVVERPGGGQVQTAPLAGTTLAAAGVPTGLFQTLTTTPSSPGIIHFTQANLFVQDQWRALPNLHLTGGIRYELNTVPDTADRRLETAFDPVELRRLAEEAARLCQPNVRCNDLVPALTAAFPADFKVSFGSDHNDFDARVGFAWAPSRLRNTSIRGGFGTYSGQFPAVVIGQIRNAFPNFLPLNLANFTPRSGNRTFLFNLASPAVQQLLPRPDDVPIGITPGSLNQLQPVNPVAFLVNQIFNLQGLSLSPTAFGLDLVLPQPKLKPPYSYHYALTVEHQFRDDYLISAAFVGTRGVQLLRVTTPALGLNDSRFRGTVGVSPLTAGEPFPFFTGQILPPQANLISQSFAIAPTYFFSSSQSTYNSLQLEFRKRYSDGLLVGSAFTYSHSIDDASDFFDNAGAFALPQNSVRSSERASSNFDVRLRSATHFVLDLQRDWFNKKEWAGTKKEWLARVLGGFQLAGIFTAQGGQPYTVNSALDINGDGNLTDRLNTTAGIIRDPAAGRVQLRLAPGVDTRDLLAPDGLDGSVGRNTFRAPHIYNIDFSVTETIPFRDHTRFVVRAEFFNLFNWANYGIPVRILESPGFGTSISTLTPPRTIQFVGKFQF